MKEDSVLKEKIGTKNPFRTPEGYFDTFSERIMQQIFDENKEKVSLYKRPVYRSKSLGSHAGRDLFRIIHLQ